MLLWHYVFISSAHFIAWKYTCLYPVGFYYKHLHCIIMGIRYYEGYQIKNLFQCIAHIFVNSYIYIKKQEQKPSGWQVLIVSPLKSNYLSLMINLLSTGLVNELFIRTVFRSTRPEVFFKTRFITISVNHRKTPVSKLIFSGGLSPYYKRDYLKRDLTGPPFLWIWWHFFLKKFFLENSTGRLFWILNFLTTIFVCCELYRLSSGITLTFSRGVLMISKTEWNFKIRNV